MEAADLAKPDAYVEVIKELGLADKISKADIEAALQDSSLPNDDYKKAMDFGVQTFPTLAVEENGAWRVFPADGMHESDLEREIIK